MLREKRSGKESDDDALIFFYLAVPPTFSLNIFQTRKTQRSISEKKFTQREREKCKWTACW